jgi:choline dehydrogenase-like flavoprotein
MSSSAGHDVSLDPRVTTPGLFLQTFGDGAIDWDFCSEPSSGLQGRRMNLPAGKCLGGSSAINFTALVQPSKRSIDAWAELGNVGWDYESLSLYYSKFANFTEPTKEVSDALGLKRADRFQLLSRMRSDTTALGHITASFPPNIDPIQKIWLDTWTSVSLDPGDNQSLSGLGGYAPPAAIDPESVQRSFAGLHYLACARLRSNLRIITQAKIDKIHIERNPAAELLKATSVKFLHGNRRYVISAQKEIKLCAGAFGSPAILERSGVGNAKLFEGQGIKSVLENSGIGGKKSKHYARIIDTNAGLENLQDHLLCGISLQVKEGINTADLLRDPEVGRSALEAYATSRSGPLASIPHSFATVCVTSDILSVASGPRSPSTEALLHSLQETSSNRVIAEDYTCGSIEPHQLHALLSILAAPDTPNGIICVLASQFHGSKTKTGDKFAITEVENYITIRRSRTILFLAVAHTYARPIRKILQPSNVTI